jgi:hypothetical protein
MHKCKPYKFVTGNKEENGVLLEGGAEERMIPGSSHFPLVASARL